MTAPELYVYYRLLPAQAEAARAQIAALRLPDGVTLRLLQRDADDVKVADMPTWMEIYQGASAQDLTLAERAVAAALAPCIEGERHIERFFPLLLPTAP
ncbi:DUF4936 family protein [Paucibacter soli]|uniref:DUF4936 family protein n=1 Tax=Paucibacter soli TaxID=3133433 RepID=UPI0030A353CD